MDRRELMVAAIDDSGAEVVVHAAAGWAGYHTLCGLSLNDDMAHEADMPSRGKINCASCWNVYTEARKLRASDFTAATRRGE